MLKRLTRSGTKKKASKASSSQVNQGTPPASPQEAQPALTRSPPSKYALFGGPSAPPPPPQFNIYDFGHDSDDEEEDTPDPDASELEAEYAFLCPTKAMCKRLRALKQRKIENTRLVNWPALEMAGVRKDFLHLTKGVGISKRFWDIDEPTLLLPTLEFLSSFELRHKEGWGYYLKFRLCNATWYCTLHRFNEIMGFTRSPDIEFPSHREGWSKEEFWSAITGEKDAKEFKVRMVQHPSLRLTLRVLSHTLFARGDTVSRALDDELKLLDAMLCDPAEKLNPGLIMVAHWENVRDSNYSGGKITMGAYVTHLGRAFNLGFADFEKATGPSLINLDYFVRSKFIRV